MIAGRLVSPRFAVLHPLQAELNRQEVRMYATVRTYSAGPELADAHVSNEADVKSLISGIDGFKAYYLVRS